MGKLRTQYNQQFLYVGPAPSTGQHFKQFSAESVFTGSNLLTGLYRIQSCNYSFNINRTPVYQFGEQVAIDRPILETPTVGLSFNYLLANAWNERALGLCVDGRQPALSGIVNRTQDDKNYFLKIAPEGVDAVSDTTDNVDVSVIGFGNGFLTSYSTQASVGSFPTVDVSVAALNMTMGTGISGKLPSIFPDNGVRVNQFSYVIPTALSSPNTGLLDISVLRPGDITMTVYQRAAQDEGILSTASGAYITIGPNINTANIQSYSLSFDLGREPLQALGSRYAKSRLISFPIDVSLSVDAIVGDLTTGSLSEIINNDGSYDIIININKPVAPGDPTVRMMEYKIKNAKLNGQSYSNSIGDNLSVSFDFSSSIGSASASSIGLFLSGVVDVQ